MEVRHWIVGGGEGGGGVNEKKNFYEIWGRKGMG